MLNSTAKAKKKCIASVSYDYLKLGQKKAFHPKELIFFNISTFFDLKNLNINLCFRLFLGKTNTYNVNTMYFKPKFCERENVKLLFVTFLKGRQLTLLAV